MIEQRLENSITAAPDSGKSAAWLQKERLGLALLLLIFIFFTWRGMTMFFSGDDMMNMYRAWDMSVWQLAQAQVMLWMPVYRPVGDAIYRLFYEVFGFNPAPLYGFCWILLAANVIAAYRVFRAVTSPVRALTSLSIPSSKCCRSPPWWTRCAVSCSKARPSPAWAATWPSSCCGA